MTNTNGTETRVTIFVGPTLPLDIARSQLDATFLPPVSQGDVYRATQQRPQVIGIIDGYFEQVPAVWHKEILYAMQEGIHVLGSASMGALRAAELAPFGMRGVGAIYEAFASGALEDDDEVAVAHGFVDEAYVNLSVAMVDIRATLSAAEKQGILSASTHQALIDVAKSLYYPDRVYPVILSRAQQSGIAPEELERLRAWLPVGQVHQKRADAMALLKAIKTLLSPDLEPFRASYTLNPTRMWHATLHGGDGGSSG